MVLSPLDFEGIITAIFGTRLLFFGFALLLIAFYSAKFRFKNIVVLMMFALFLIFMNTFGFTTFIVTLIVVGGIIGGWLYSKTTKT